MEVRATVAAEVEKTLLEWGGHDDGGAAGGRGHEVVVDEEEAESTGSGSGSSAAPLPVLALLFVEAIACCRG